MNALPVGEHVVCVVATEPKRTKDGKGGYQAVVLEVLYGEWKGRTHTDRLNLVNANKQAERLAEERLSHYCLAVGIHPKTFRGFDDLMFKPFVVEIRQQAKNPNYLEAKALKALPQDWRANAEALGKERASRAATPPPSAPNAQGAGWQSPGDALVIRRVSDVEAKSVSWLWRNRFALGKVSILAGDPGLGKSQLTNYLAAQVSTGGAWPNGEGSAEQGDAIILSCEDDLADTIRPRLEAARADLTRIHVIEAIMSDDGKRRGFRLTDDLQRLENALQQLHGRARLVIIDPITAYMGKTDSHKVADVRAVLAPVQDLAAQYGVAVIAVSHTNKSGGNGKAVNAVTGSQAYVGVSRATWIVTKDDENEDRRLLLQVKNNLGTAQGLAFRVMVAHLPTGEAPCIVFDPGYVEKTADQVLSEAAQPALGRSQMDKAKAFLQQELASGYVEASALVERAGFHGITERTLQRAADKVGVLKRKNGFGGGWEWGFAMSPGAVAALFGQL